MLDHISIDYFADRHVSSYLKHYGRLADYPIDH
jgi:hypothetical protein